jgi:HK97 family phage major capsid protein
MSDYLAELRAERERAQKLEWELAKMRARTESSPLDEGARERVANLERGLAKCRDRIADLGNGVSGGGGIERVLDAADRLREIASNPRNREEGTNFGTSNPDARRGAAFEEVQRRLEELHRDADLSTEAVDRLDLLARQDTTLGADTQYIAAVSQPEYATAFGKLLAHGDGAFMRMNDAERSAVEQMFKADRFRAMAEGTSTAGGYALPITIDPTMNLVSNGAINPIRQLATVRTITTLELRLSATDGVVASYAAEATEATDNSPTLAQPDILVERAQCFVPISFELFDDWTNLQQQLQGLFADAKDVLEATKFLTGGGHAASEPAGIVGGVTGSLTASQKVSTTGTASVSTHDIYALRAAVPPRFIGSTSICTSPAIQDILWNLVPRASTTDNILMPDREHVLEFPHFKWSTMATTLTSANIIAIAGDFKRGYTIADRIGLNVEMIPQLFGPNRRPTGQRGMFAFWRNSAAVIASSDNAPLRYLATS